MRGENVVDLHGRREAPEPGPCPIVPLGQLDGEYFFLSPGGELRRIGESRLGAVSAQLSLFDGDPSWLEARWPRWDKGGNTIIGHDRERACAGLMALCAEAGLWDPDTPVRGRGVWMTRGGRVLCHAGDRLHYGGEHGEDARPAGKLLGGAVYPRRPALDPPALEPAPAQLVAEWKRAFGWWRFQPLGLGGAGSDRGPEGLAADLLFSATALAMLGAAPSWRVHTLVRAVHGAGKSTLIAFVAAALGAQCVTMNNFTEPGLRQTLADEARAVLLDEAEGDDGGVMAQVIRVIRQMSGGDGVRGARGSGDGRARHFQIAGCAFLACINMPALLPQDLSRILIVEMLPAPAAHERAARAAVEQAGDWSPALRRRALDGWGRFQANLALTRAALLARGCSGRQADQLGALLAAGAMMQEDTPIDARDADDLAEGLVPLIEATKAEEADGSDALRCWRLLLSQPVASWRQGDMMTVGGLLATARGENAVDARRHLDEACGVRLELGSATRSMPETPCLYVTKQHAFLRHAFRDTPWREGGWVHSLARLDGACASANSVRVARLKQRVIAIPLEHLPRPRGGIAHNGSEADPDDGREPAGFG